MSNLGRNESVIDLDYDVDDNIDELVEMPPPPLPKDERKRKWTSVAWDHFTELPNCTEDKPQAKCNYCVALYMHVI